MLTSNRSSVWSRSSNSEPFLRRLVPAGCTLALTVAVACSSAPPVEATGTTSSAATISGLFATGVDNSGVPLTPGGGATDPHYVLTSVIPVDPGSAPLVVNPAGGWVAPAAT